MTPEAIARAIADALDGTHHEPGYFTIASIDSDPTTVWITASTPPGTDGAAGVEFRLTVERHP